MLKNMGVILLGQREPKIWVCHDKNRREKQKQKF